MTACPLCGGVVVTRSVRYVGEDFDSGEPRRLVEADSSCRSCGCPLAVDGPFSISDETLVMLADAEDEEL